MLFNDRAQAGRALGERLRYLRGERPVVLGLPRGGVPVAYEVARALDAPLDVIVVRKLGVPYQPELGFGAIGEGGVRIVRETVVRGAGVRAQELAEVERTERAELERRARRFREDRPRIPLTGRTAVVVDDGMATGSTAWAACRVAREQGARRVVLALPVAPPDSVAALRREADEVVCLSTPPDFMAVGEWYEDFGQTTDAEVVELLARAREAATPSPAAPAVPAAPSGGLGPAGGQGGPLGPGDRPAARDVETVLEADGIRLPGRLTVPEGAREVVVFSHGSGSSRHSVRNRYVAERLNQAGLGTLLFDLLTPQEAHDRANVFDVGLLAARLVAVTRLLRDQGYRVAYFGASTGAAAALCAAAEFGAEVCAVVSRGGRPDLAGPRLGDVRAPTLLVVGGADTLVLGLNRQAQSRLRCESDLVVVPGATHLFEEPGALERVAELAEDWFVAHLALTR